MVPFPAGGPTDTSARLVAQGMAAKLGQPIVIENQAGAGGAIGARQVANAAPDGYTLMIVVGRPHLRHAADPDQARLRSVQDLRAGRNDGGRSPGHGDEPVAADEDAGRVVQYAKANPGKLNNGAAVGIGPHFIMELFKIKAGVNIVHVPYRGSAPIITDLIAGQIQLTMSGKSVLLPHIEAGKMRAIAVTSAKRWSELPDVPTLVEAGYLDFPYDTMSGIVTRDRHAAGRDRTSSTPPSTMDLRCRTCVWALPSSASIPIPARPRSLPPSLRATLRAGRRSCA